MEAYPSAVSAFCAFRPGSEADCASGAIRADSRSPFNPRVRSSLHESLWALAKALGIRPYYDHWDSQTRTPGTESGRRN